MVPAISGLQSRHKFPGVGTGNSRRSGDIPGGHAIPGTPYNERIQSHNIETIFMVLDSEGKISLSFVEASGPDAEWATSETGVIFQTGSA